MSPTETDYPFAGRGTALRREDVWTYRCAGCGRPLRQRDVWAHIGWRCAAGELDGPICRACLDHPVVRDERAYRQQKLSDADCALQTKVVITAEINPTLSAGEIAGALLPDIERAQAGQVPWFDPKFQPTRETADYPPAPGASSEAIVRAALRAEFASLNTMDIDDDLAALVLGEDRDDWPPGRRLAVTFLYRPIGIAQSPELRWPGGRLVGRLSIDHGLVLLGDPLNVVGTARARMTDEIFLRRSVHRLGAGVPYAIEHYPRRAAGALGLVFVPEGNGSGSGSYPVYAALDDRGFVNSITIHFVDPEADAATG